MKGLSTLVGKLKGSIGHKKVGPNCSNLMTVGNRYGT